MTDAGDAQALLVQIVEAVQQALGGGAPVVVATVVRPGDVPGLEPGRKLAVRADGWTAGGFGDERIDAAMRREAIEALDARPRAELVTVHVGADARTTSRRSQARPGDAQLMVEVFEAKQRLLIVGGGHVGLALARLGADAGFSVAVLDDRLEFANLERFPMAAEIYTGDIASTMDGIEVDGRTYVVLVSRGHQQDETALRHAVGRGAAYVGMIGSRRRTGTVLNRLAADGFSGEALDAVHTPIGLDIGAETPEEIAVSILAEIVMERRGGTGRPMRAARGRAASPDWPASRS